MPYSGAVTRRRYAYRKPWLRLLARTIDLVGDRLLARPSASPETLAGSLVVRFDQLGDGIQTLPLLDAAQARHGAASLEVLTTPLCAPVFARHPATAQVYGWPCPGYAGRPYDREAWSWLVEFLKTRRPPCVVDPRGDFRVISAAWWAGVPVRVGFGATGGGCLLTHELPWDPSEHQIDRTLRLANGLGAPAPVPHPVWPGRDELQPARGLDRPYLVVHPDAGAPAKRWEATRFVAVIRKLLEARPDLGVVLVGLDADRGEAIRRAADSPRVVSYMGLTDLEGLAAVLQGSEGMLTCDSGPAHVAAALGRRVWVLWSGVAPPALWEPRGAPLRRFEAPASCAPCSRRECPVVGHPCMAGITPDTVATCILRDLNDAAGGGGTP